jgi:hypothetical protein
MRRGGLSKKDWSVAFTTSSESTHFGCGGHVCMQLTTPKALVSPSAAGVPSRHVPLLLLLPPLVCVVAATPVLSVVAFKRLIVLYCTVVAVPGCDSRAACTASAGVVRSTISSHSQGDDTLRGAGEVLCVFFGGGGVRRGICGWGRGGLGEKGWNYQQHSQLVCARA